MNGRYTVRVSSVTETGNLSKFFCHLILVFGEFLKCILCQKI